MKLKPILKLLLICALFASACKNDSEKFVLPVLGPKSLDKKNDTIYHTVGEFQFTNQFNETVTNATVKDKIYVADFFFATCQSICPVMSGNLKDVQKEFENDKSFLILSHSVNPLHDTVEVLKNYGETYGAKKGKWHLLTGNKKQIYELAKSAYLVNALEDDGSEEGFLHSELFLLVDKKGRIRGMYDGTDKAAITKLIADIKLLKTEE
jgi:protein SCO1/2